MKRAFFAFILIGLFSGCTISEEGVELSSIDDDTECEDSGGLFCDDDDSDSDLELVIESESVTPASAFGDCRGNDTRDLNGDKSISEQDVYCFDFSGQCNESSLDSAFVVGRLSLESFGTTYALGSCVRGSFHVQVRLGLSGSQLCEEHTLELELIGKKADGTEVTKPATAKKRRTFQVRNNVVCSS